jgi:hypothetical protein
MTDISGPTSERVKRADGFFDITGRGRSNLRFSFLDDALGRAWKRQQVTGEEYQALRKYSLHWLAGGLAGHIGSVDLNRVLAFNPSAMTGLAKTEKQVEHRRRYREARASIGIRPALVADHVACFDSSMTEVALALGYRSPSRGREKAVELLSEAGYRLVRFWDERH